MGRKRVEMANGAELLRFKKIVTDCCTALGVLPEDLSFHTCTRTKPSLHLWPPLCGSAEA